MEDIRHKNNLVVGLLIVLIMALATTAVMAYFVYDRTLYNLANSRFEFIGRDLKARIEAGLDLGLPLGQLENIDTFLRREINADDALLSAGVVNAKGSVLYNTNSTQVYVPDAATLKAKSTSSEENKDISIVDNNLMFPIFTNFGKNDGWLIISVSRKYYNDKKSRTAINLIIATGLSLFICGLISIFCNSRIMNFTRNSRSSDIMHSNVKEADESKRESYTPIKRLQRSLFAFQCILLLLGSGCVAYSAQHIFEADLQTDMTRKGEVISRSLAAQFERALEQGVAFRQIRGVDDLFDNLRNDNHELRFILAAETDENGRATHVFVSGKSPLGGIDDETRPVFPAQLEAALMSQNPTIIHLNKALVVTQPVIVDGHLTATILLGIDADYIVQQLSSLFYDILVVLVVSLLITVELLLLIIASTGSSAETARALPTAAREMGVDRIDHGPLASPVGSLLAARSAWSVAGMPANQSVIVGGGVAALQPSITGVPLPTLGDRQRSTVGNEETLVRVRIPLFVFFVSEELSRPFFPLYAKSLAASLPGISPDIVVSLPMMLFMLIVAFSQPLGGPWAQRLGARRMLLLGSLVGAVGLALTAFAWDFYSLLVWRLVTAAGYGMVFVAGQSHIIANTGPKNRAWGMAMFVGSVLAASICGPAIGGILADRLGYAGTFCVSAASALSAGALAWHLLPDSPRAETASSRGLRLGDVRLVLGNRRFLALMVGGAMPAKIILTGFLYYLAPMYLAQLGNSPAAAGRILMLYGLMMVLITPVAARLADRVRRPMAFVAGGGILSACGALAILSSSSASTVIAAVVILGIAQAISITPQIALVPTACPDECKRLGQVTVIGFFRLFERIGSALGPVLAAILLHGFGYQIAAAAIGAIVGVASISLALIWFATQPR